MKNDFTLAILTGGHSKRFGPHKAFVTMGNQTLISRIANTISSSEKLIIAGNNNIHDFQSYQTDKINVKTDLIHNCGPLGGIYTALFYASFQSVMIMPSDLPLMNTQAILYLLKHDNPNVDAIIPVTNEMIHPVSAIYHRTILPELKTYLTKNNKLSVRKFIAGLNTSFIRIPDKPEFRNAFLNMNTPLDYEHILKIFNNES